MLYSHNDSNDNNNNTGRLFCFGYKQVYFFLPSLLGDMRRETKFIKTNANHTMLIALIRFKKLNCYLQLSNLSSKPWNSQDHPFQLWCQPLTQFIPASFPIWEFIIQMMIVISFPCRRASALSDYDTWTRDTK